MWPFKKKVELGPNLRFAKACAEVAEEERSVGANVEKGAMKKLNYSEMSDEELAKEFRQYICAAKSISSHLKNRGYKVYLTQGGGFNLDLISFRIDFNVNINKEEVTEL